MFTSDIVRELLTEAMDRLGIQAPPPRTTEISEKMQRPSDLLVGKANRERSEQAFAPEELSNPLLRPRLVQDSISVATLSFVLPDAVFRIPSKLRMQSDIFVSPIIDDIKHEVFNRLNIDIDILDGHTHFGSLFFKGGRVLLSTKTLAVIAGTYGGVATYPDFKQGFDDLIVDTRHVITGVLRRYGADKIEVEPENADAIFVRVRQSLEEPDGKKPRVLRAPDS